MTTPDPTLAARLAELRTEITDEPLHGSGRYFNESHFDLAQCHHGETGNFTNKSDGKLIAILWNAYHTGQLITLAEAEAMVLAENEACAAIADAYASENITMAHDTVIFDPVLSGKNGDHLTRSDFKKSEELAISGTIHSSMFHAAQNVAAAIRARGVE